MGAMTNTPEMDAALTFLTVDQAAEVRRLVHQAFATRGIESVIHADRVEAAGAVYGLWNVAAQCHSCDSHAEWPQVVADHVAKMLRTQEQTPDFSALAPEELMGLLKWRLSDEEMLRGGVPEHASEFAPGVIRHLVADLPESIMTVRDDVLAGLPMGRAMDQAAAATRALLDTEEFDHHRLGEGDQAFDAVVGDSVFTATLAMFLPDVVARFRPDVDPRRGIIFALPNRHQIAFAVPTSGLQIVSVVQILLQFTIAGYQDGVSPVSPNLFLWHDGQIDQLTRINDGQVEVHPTGPLLDLLGEE